MRDTVALRTIRQNVVELRTDGRDMATCQVNDAHYRTTGQQRRKMTRQADPQTRPENQDPQRDHANGGITKVNGRQGHKQRTHFLQVVFRDVCHLQTEKIFNLHGTDGDTDT
ncbi:hypothetical protein D3C73_1303420 [compost metagenome]